MQVSEVESLVERARQLRAEQRCDEALDCVERALTLDPDSADAHAGRGATLVRLNRIDEGIQSFRQALELRPFDPWVLNSMGNARLLQARVEEALALFRQAIGQAPRYAQAHSNLLFAMLFDIRVSPEALLAQHEAFGRVFEGDRNPAPHTNSPDPGRRLRVGYVSGDFYHHPVHFFFENALAHHNRAEFEITCYSSTLKPDSVTARLEAMSDRWRVIDGTSDAEVDELIRRDEIDILVDLSGHSGDIHLTLFARKPAPVQITWLGYPATTGLRAVDYRITDAFADPPGMTDAQHTEELIRLPRTFLCYRPPDDVPPVLSPPARPFTFGSFSKPVKWNSEVIGCWARILHRVPGSRLLLHHGIGSRHQTLRQEVVARFADLGITGDRVGLIGRVGEQEHFELYHRVDLVLDTFPYNGTTSTCEALWMGVPSVVLAGDRHVARVGVSLMKNVGLDSFIASSQAEYVDLAVALSARRDDLAQLRQQMRSRLLESPLLDAPAFTRSLEAAYRAVWLRWSANR